MKYICTNLNKEKPGIDCRYLSEGRECKSVWSEDDGCKYQMMKLDNLSPEEIDLWKRVVVAGISSDGPTVGFAMRRADAVVVGYMQRLGDKRAG